MRSPDAPAAFPAAGGVPVPVRTALPRAGEGCAGRACGCRGEGLMYSETKATYCGLFIALAVVLVAVAFAVWWIGGGS